MTTAVNATRTAVSAVIKARRVASMDGGDAYQAKVAEADRRHGEAVAAANARHEKRVKAAEAKVAAAEAALEQVREREAADLAAALEQADQTHVADLEAALGELEVTLAESVNLKCTPQRDELRPSSGQKQPLASIEYRADETTLTLPRTGRQVRGGRMTHEDGHRVLMAAAVEIAAGN